MKTFILAILILFNFTTLSAQLDLEFKPDKQKHFAVSTVFGGTITTLMLRSKYKYDDWETIVAPQPYMAFVGLGKEFADATILNGIASIEDVIYNQFGCLVGSVTAYGINKGIDYLRARKKKKENNKLKL